ncbi:MAG: PAS domain-containing protein, partial [Bacteroidales bacterium]|nr:PAS domain-containing protein [Bacteroidales bacterium]
MAKRSYISQNPQFDYQNLYTPMFTYSDKILWANAPALKFLDVEDLNEVVGRRFEDFAPGIQPDGQSITAKIDYALNASQGNEPANIHLQFCLPTNRYKYAEVSVIKLPEKFLFVLHDVTRYAERENELRYRVNRLEKAITTGSDTVFQLNLNTRSFYFFPSLLRLLGYNTNRSSITMDEYLELVYEDDLNLVLNVFKDFDNPKFQERFDEVRLRCSDGSYIWVWFRGTLETLDFDGKPLIISGTATNVNIKKESEKSLLNQT